MSLYMNWNITLHSLCSRINLNNKIKMELILMHRLPLLSPSLEINLCTRHDLSRLSRTCAWSKSKITFISANDVYHINKVIEKADERQPGNYYNKLLVLALWARVARWYKAVLHTVGSISDILLVTLLWRCIFSGE